MHGKQYFNFDGAHVYFYQDISRHTLMQRRALRPLLEAVQKAGLPYPCGFLFYLQVSKDDLPHFLETLGLEAVDFPDWSGRRTTLTCNSFNPGYQLNAGDCRTGLQTPHFCLPLRPCVTSTLKES